MPIQITELNISVSVNQPGSGHSVPSANPEEHRQDNTKMLDECIEQVMKIIHDKKER